MPLSCSCQGKTSLTARGLVALERRLQNRQRPPLGRGESAPEEPRLAAKIAVRGDHRDARRVLIDVGPGKWQIHLPQRRIASGHYPERLDKNHRPRNAHRRSLAGLGHGAKIAEAIVSAGRNFRAVMQQIDRQPATPRHAHPPRSLDFVSFRRIREVGRHRRLASSHRAEYRDVAQGVNIDARRTGRIESFSGRNSCDHVPRSLHSRAACKARPAFASGRAGLFAFLPARFHRARFSTAFIATRSVVTGKRTAA